MKRDKAVPQKEIAARIGVSERWYRSLEAGDSLSLSSDVLGRLSEALALGPDERMILYSRALDGAGIALADEDGEAEGQLALLQLVTAQTQFPAYLTDGAWNILGYNALMAAWFPWVREPGANLMLWALNGEEAREQLLDWAQHAEVYLAMLRFAVATGSPARRSSTLSSSASWRIPNAVGSGRRSRNSSRSARGTGIGWTCRTCPPSRSASPPAFCSPPITTGCAASCCCRTDVQA
ncbi:hypothetical protein [Kitasatospora paranensis]|uniref:helix-turn-helix domain-containing protein n=1 Tax=Kitasatospora paranensis TaxID=258053 RepID=UPI0031EF82A6